MASTAARQQASGGAGPSSSYAAPPSSQSQAGSSQQSQQSQPEVSLLGTLSLSGVAALLHHITGRSGAGFPVAVMPGVTLCERETVLQRVDDESSSVRETGDNAWASVVKARRGVRLHVLESLHPTQSTQEQGRVDCKLLLPLPALPERQYPRATVRPTHTVQMMSNDLHPAFSSQHTPLSTDQTHSLLLPFDPDVCLDTDRVNGWKSFTSAVGWSSFKNTAQATRFVRYGLSFPLNHVFSRNPSSTTDPLAPTQSTRFTLNVFRLFIPPPTGTPSEPWMTVDPLGATVVVHLTATVGGQLDQAHFNPYSSASIATSATSSGGLDPASTVDNALEVVEAIARNLRGYVDLRRLSTD